MGIFLFLGAAMASLAGTTLVWPGTLLDRAWEANPRAYQALAPMGKGIGIAFFLLAVTLAVAATGWMQRRRWGWWLAVTIVATQVFGNLLNIIERDLLRGCVGFVIAGTLLWCLQLPRVRAHFQSPEAPDKQS